MFLFNKEKELILKITNAVLLVWFLAAIIFTFNSGINLLEVKPNKQEQYQICVKDNCSLDQKPEECGCSRDYYYEDDNYDKMTLYKSIANVLVVGVALYFLNKEKVKKIKK